MTAEIINPEILYTKLFDYYGPQGWWPVTFNRREICDNKGYHKISPVIDISSVDIFEISAGAVLTQNTSWNNVSKALNNLSNNVISDLDKFLEASPEKILSLLKPSGYYNQKYRKLVLLFNYYKREKILEFPERILRETLLGLWGVGEETADSILLYAFNKPYFVIDSYTKRLLSRMLNISYGSYNSYARYFTESISKSVIIYNEYHALIVKHCVDICRKKPLCNECFIEKFCRKVIS